MKTISEFALAKQTTRGINHNTLADFDLMAFGNQNLMIRGFKSNESKIRINSRYDSNLKVYYFLEMRKAFFWSKINKWERHSQNDYDTICFETESGAKEYKKQLDEAMNNGFTPHSGASEKCIIYLFMGIVLIALFINAFMCII